MRAGFYTLGCKVNQYETQLMRESLQKRGYEIVEADDCPDVFIINSCTVTSESDRKTRQTVRKYRRLLPDAVIVLTGCVPQAFPNVADELECADIVIGNACNNELPDLLDRFFIDRKRIVDIKHHDKQALASTISGFESRTKAFLKIQDGCDRFCTYCIIPFSRGRMRSKPLDNIRSEVESLAKQGHREVVLIGINLTAYHTDDGYDLADAVRVSGEVEGIERVRLGSLEPDMMTDELISRLKDTKELCPQFHLSLQAGCDKTLKKMNRRYTTADYRHVVKKLRQAFENCAVTTDIMVGFAGETEQDFEESVAFVREIGFSKVNVFPYSRRKGTAADNYTDHIDEHTKRCRTKTMLAAADETQREFLKSRVGKTMPVLFESVQRDGLIEGYTPDYTLVRASADADICGRIIDVELRDIEGGGFKTEINR